MDKTFNGITWFGNMYQKFEAVCLEVDDIVNQEALRYLGNQVQTVGSNVKQFCTEFMEEVLLPSEQVAEEEVDISLKQKTELEGEQTAKEVCSPSRHSCADVCSGISVEQSSDHGKFDNLKVKVTENPIHGHIQLMTECKSTMKSMVDDGSSSYLTSTRASDPLELTQCHKSGILDSVSTPNSIESAEKSETYDLELNSRTTVIDQEALQSRHVCGNLVGVVSSNPIVDEHMESEMKSLNMQEGEGSANCLATTESCNFVDQARCFEVKLLENDYTPDNFCVESADESENIVSTGSNNKKYAIEMESLEVLDAPKLEGSCIIVDSNEQHSFTNESKGCRSYKKKLEAFSRSMLARHGRQQGNSSKPSILNGRSEASNLAVGDSDWELV